MATTTITTETQLLGPPELYKEDLTTNNQVDLSTKIADPIVDDDDDKSPTDNIDDDDDGTTAVMGLTETCSATFLKTGNPCLDFFFHILPDTPKESLIKRLELAWKHNPLMTLKLICHLRGVRGTGKSDKEGFYVAALWLHENHPKTLALNVKWFAEFGYLKDLLEILYRLLAGLEVRKEDKTKREKSLLSWKRGKRMEKTVKEVVWRKGKREIVEKNAFKARRSSNPREKKRCKKDAEDPALKMERLNLNEKKRKEKMERDAAEIKTPRNLKKKKIAEVGKKALQRYANDPNYHVLYEKISDHFAELLVSDIKFLKSKQYGKISLAAKWCPSLDCSYDRATLICESIARKVFPRASYPEYEGIEEAHYAYRVRDRLRKQVLVPLRQALELPEIYMTAKKWDSLPYQRVASVAMKLYKRLFMEHDSERFSGYLQDVSEGKAKIAAGALLPHEIISSLDEDGEDLSQVAELQWKRMVEDLSAKGTLNNCIAVCDVSGSMCGLPMDVCIALGLLISELSSGPWKGKVITFSAHPTLQIVEGDSLAEKKQFVANMHWGMNTDFQKVFDLLLAVAVKGKLNESKMIKRIFVFSDMEFDQASTNDWETDYQVIQKKFNEQGYGSAIPEMVFWNLRDSRSTPVAAKQNGAALVSGYSKNILNLFLEGDGPLNPEVIMESAISGPEYNNLHVFD